MKSRFIYIFLLTIFCFSQSVQAISRYVKVNGEGDGLSWETAKGEIQSAIWDASVGDTIYVASGIYNEGFSLKDGVSVLGGYNSQTGERNIELYETILDGTNLVSDYFIVAYNGDFINPTIVEGITIRNKEGNKEGGGAYIRGNITLSKCYILNCKGSNGGGVYNNGGKIMDCIIELCSSTSSGGGVYNLGGTIENTILRGNQGKYGTIRNEKRDEIISVVNNCIIVNNEASVNGWPNSGGIYNKGGIVANCIIANNVGTQYSAIHSDGQVVNTIFWNNSRDEAHTDVLAYMSSGSESSNNAAISGSSAACVLTLNSDNMHVSGPNFRSPVLFQGLPKTDADIAAMRAADWTLTVESPCIDRGTSFGAPLFDINGVSRPKGNAYDIGAYELDPDAVYVPVELVQLTLDTLRLEEGDSQWLSAIIFPQNATNKSITWLSLDEDIATVNKGLVAAETIGKTIVRVYTIDGNKKDSCVIIVSEKIIPEVHQLVKEADLLDVSDYSIPNWTKMLIAKEAARKDSSELNIAVLQGALDHLIDKRVPHSVVANINKNPVSQMAFAWFTGIGVNEGKVQLVAKTNATETDFENPFLEFEANHQSTKNLNYAVTTSDIPKLTGLSATTKYNYTSHKAIATGLSSGTSYSYRVGSEGYWSDIYSFTTAKESKDEFKFIYMTDSHIMNDEYIENARWAGASVANNVSDAGFLLFTGDFVETGTGMNAEWEWEQWFETSMKPALKKIPLVPTDGNHDDSPNLNFCYHFNTDDSFYASATVKPQFYNSNYSFVYGDALFIVYSHQDYYKTGYLETSIIPWMKEQVEANPDTKWRIVAYHKNIFTGSGHQKDADAVFFRQKMLPLYDELGIDFAIQGHDHVYEVIGPVDCKTRTLVPNSVSNVKNTAVNTNTNMTGKEGGVFDVSNGTLFFVNGTSGRKRYYPLKKEDMETNLSLHGVENYWDLFTGKFGQLGAPAFSEITVNSDEIIVDTYAADTNGGRNLFDSFKIVKTSRNTGKRQQIVSDVLYPIPAKDVVNVKYGNIVKATAVDTGGRCFRLPINQQAIDVSLLNDGLYLLQITTPEKTENHKLIKKTN